MNSSGVTGTIQYGRKLVNAGFDGIRNGQPVALNGQPLSSVLLDSATGAVTLAAAGAGVALLGSYFLRKRGRPSHLVGFGILGTALGFCAGAIWKSRKVTSSLAQSAIKEMHKASDEHWLERHPVDYA